MQIPLVFLILLVLFWLLAERRYKRLFAELSSAGPEDGITWEDRMAVVRGYDRLNRVVALLAVVSLGALFGFSYQHYQAIVSKPDPPLIIAGEPHTPVSAGQAIHWRASYPGGRIATVVGDHGYVLMRGVRGRYDQYFLVSSHGTLLWSSERSYLEPAPRTALKVQEQLASLAVETTNGAAAIFSIGPDGAVGHPGELERFPQDGDPLWHALKDSANRTTPRNVSSDGLWRIETRARLSSSWVSSTVSLYGPPSRP